jgi:Arc/MetJ-type ribon-helix-helix transcriptional regulator
MRCIVSLSLPEELCEEVEVQMKKHKFTSKSEFIRHIIRFWLKNN